MNAALLALLIGAVYFAPAHIAGWAHWSPAAVEYVAYGVESAVKWGILGWLCVGSISVSSRCGCGAFDKPTATERRIMAVVCAWGAFEAIQRPVCRAMFDLSHKVALPDGMTMCEAAFGLPIGWLGFVVAGAVIARLSGAKNGR